MPYLNSRLHALLALGLLFLAAPGLHAQEASVVSSVIRGDVDGDGQVTAADAAAVRAYLVRGTEPQGRSILPAGDANGDGRVTAADAALISRYAAGVDVSRFPVGRPVGEGGGRLPTIDASGMRMMFYECTTSIVTGETSCRAPAPNGGGASLDVIAGSPHVVVTTTRDSVISHGTALDTVIMTVTLHNNMKQPMGTADGVNPDPAGSKMFFQKTLRADSAVTGVKPGGLTVIPVGADSANVVSEATGSNWTNVKYYQFDGLVQPADSISREIRIAYDPRALRFRWVVLVATKVSQARGWITITPPADSVIALSATLPLVDSAFYFTGARNDTATKNWQTSNSSVATVNSSGMVTGVAEGTAIISVSTLAGIIADSVRIVVDRFPEVLSTDPADNAVDVAPTSDIVVTFTEPVTVDNSSFELKCPSSGSALPYTLSGSGTATITLNPNADLVPGLTCEVTVKGNEVEDVDSNDGPNFMPGQYVFTFEVGIDAVDDDFAPIVLGNVEIDSDTITVLENDEVGPTTTITFFGSGGNSGQTAQGGTVVVDPDGTFTYDPPAGYEGADSFEYTLTAGSQTSTGTVSLDVAGMIWFVDGDAASECTTHCGRKSSPFKALSTFNTANAAGGNSNPADNEPVFLYEGAAYTGPINLRAGQRLIGQDATGVLATLANVAVPAGSSLPATNSGNADKVTIGGPDGVNLAAGNTLRGLTLTTTGGQAIFGSTFGTLTLADGSPGQAVDVSIASGGQALSLTTGTIVGTFASVGSTGGTNNVLLSGVTGDIDFGTGTLSGSSGGAIKIFGGPLTLDVAGSVSQTSGVAAPLLDVGGSHTGTLTFTGTSNLQGTAGTGLQFNAAGGTYVFLGTTNLSGDSAGIDITNGSAGTFTFGTSTTISNPASVGFNLYGSTAGVTYSGSINKSSAGNAIEIGEHSGGTVTFQTGTISIGGGTGIRFSNADGIYNFNGTATLNGGDAGIDIIGDSGGTFAFSANTHVTNPTGTAFNVNGSTPNVTFNGSLIRTANNALLVDLTNVALAAGKTITFDPAAGTDSLYATIGDGIQLSNVDGAVDFNGRVRLAGGNAGVDIVAGSSGNIDFDAATIVNPTGEALRIFNGSGGDQAADVSFAGAISTNAGRAVLIEDVLSGTVAVSASINTTAGLGILVQNNSGGTMTFSNTTKSLTTAANPAVTISNNGATVNFPNGGLVIQTTTGAGFSASGGGTVTVEGTTNSVNSTSGGTAVSINGTTIGGNGVRFVSISSSGAANGIFLSNTGASGGSFRVDGTGAVGSGGSILNTSGGDGATSGNGVYLNNVRNVLLTSMIINDHPNHGIFGQTVHGFTLDNSRLAGTHGTNVGFDEAVISITGLDGQAVFSNDSISGGIEDNVRILNHGIVSAATDSILFNNVRMGHVNSTSGNTALLVRVADGSTNRVRIRNSTFHGSRGGSMFHLNVVNTATARLALDANTFNNTQTQISGAGGVLITASGTAASVPTLTYNITGNTFRGSRTVALNINKDVGQAVINGNISGNTIGVAATANSGSVDGSGIQLRHQGGGTHRATVTNNQIFQYNNYGIILEAGDAVAGGGHGRMDMTVTGNTISNPGTLAFPWNGLHANIGTVTDDAHILCMAASGNSLDNSGTATQDIRLRQRMKTTVILPGYGGSASDNTAVNNFVKANNGNGANLAVVASNSVGVAAPNGPGNGFINGSCNAPTL